MSRESHNILHNIQATRATVGASSRMCQRGGHDGRQTMKGATGICELRIEKDIAYKKDREHRSRAESKARLLVKGF